MNITFFFRIALIINGIGSCGIVMAMPYYFANLGLSETFIYFYQGIVFFAIALGALFWGNRIDNAVNIWSDKIKITMLEFSFSVLTLLSISAYKNITLFCVSLSLLQFLFIYEISWSRIAYNKIPNNKNKDREKIAQEVTVAVAVISIFAPVLGAYMGTKNFILYIGIFNLLSFLPYLTISFIIYNKTCIHLNKNKKAILDSKIRFKEFLKLFLEEKKMIFFWGGVFLCSISLGFFTSALPILLISNFGHDNKSIAVFYALTGTISVLLNFGIIRKKISQRLRNSYFLNISGILISGLIFILSANFYVLGLSYLLYYSFWIGLNILFTQRIYSYQNQNIHGRLFAFYQFILKLTLPMASFSLFLATSKYSYEVLLFIFIISLGMSIAFFKKLSSVDQIVP